jgi:phosphonate transport system permease protein
MPETFTREIDLPPVGTPPLPRPSLLNKRTLWGLLTLAAIGWSLAQVGLFQKEIVNTGGWNQMVRFLQATLHPEVSPQFLALTFKAAIVTLAYAVWGTVLSVLFGLIGGILASEVWWQSVFPARGGNERQGRSYWLSIRALLAIPRAIHEIIWGLFFVNIFGLDPLTAIMAIAIPYGAIVAKVFSEILDETPRQPLLALLHSGVSPLKAFAYALLPQAFPDLLSYTFYRFECSIRAAAILGIIGAGGLGFEILLSLQALHYDQLWTLFYALFILNGLVDYWSALLRRRFSHTNRLDLEQKQITLTASSTPRKNPTYRHDTVVKGSLLLTGLLLPFSFWYIQPDLSKLWSPRTMQLLGGVMRDSFPPRFATDQLSTLISLSGQTLT